MADQRGRGRDRVGQGPADPARRLRRAGAAGRARDPPLPRRARRPCTRATSGRSARGLLDFDDLIGACTDALETDPVVRGDATVAVPPPLRRRVPGRHPRPARSRAGLARRGLRPVRGRRPGPGDLLVRRSRLGAAGALPDWFEGRGRRAARRELPVDPRDRRRGARGAPRAVPRAKCAPPGTRGRRRRSPPTRTTRRGARRGGRAARGPRADAAVVVHGRALPGQRAVGCVRGGAAHGPGSRPVCAVRPASSTGRRSRSSSTSSARPRTPRRVARSRSTSRTSSPTRPNGPRSAASTSTRGRARPRVPRGRGQHRIGRRGSWNTCARPCAAGTTEAWPRTRWTCSRSTAPRASSGTRSSSPGSSAVSSRSRTRPAGPTRSTRSAASCTSRSSRAERYLHLSWARQRARGARTSSRTRSPYLTEITARDRRRDRGRAAAPGRARTRAGRREGAARRAAERRARARRTAPLFDALVRWRGDLARAAAVPPSVILDTKTLRQVASARPRSSDALLALPGIGPVKLQRYGAALLEVVDRHPG